MLKTTKNDCIYQFKVEALTKELWIDSMQIKPNGHDNVLGVERERFYA